MLKHPPTSLIAHGVQILAILYCVDLLDQVLKDITYVDICKRTSFHKEQFVLSSVVCSEFSGYFTLARVLFGKIKFITD